MTTVGSSGSTSPPRPPQAPPPSRLALVLQNERRDLLDILGRVARRACRCNLDDAKDHVSNAFLSAVLRERKGNGWNPDEESIDTYMIKRLFNTLKDARTKAKRKPATPVGDIDDVSSAAPGGLAGLVASAADADDELQALRRLAADLVRFFQEETGGKIPLGIMEQHLLGIDSHPQIARRLGCSRGDVKRGWDRLKHHGARVADAARGEGKPS